MSWYRTHRLFLGLLAVVALLRLGLILGPLHGVNGDEAVIGSMALHVASGREHPLFFYGQPRNGGGAVCAYLGALSFSIFGAGERSLKAVAWLLSLFALIAVYFSAQRLFDRRSALWAAALYASAPWLQRMSLVLLGGYQETQILVPLFVLLLMRCLAPVARVRELVLLGAMAGFGLYLQESFLVPLVLALLLLSLTSGWRAGRSLGLFLIGATVGALPMIAYDLGHGGAHWRYLRRLSSSKGPLWERLLDTPHWIGRYLVEELPRSLGNGTVFGIARHSSAQAYLELLLMAGALLGLTVLVVVALWRWAWGFLDDRFGGAGREDRAAGALFLYLLLFLALLGSQGVLTKNARYFLPAEPVLSMLTGVALARLFARWRPRVARALQTLALLGVCAVASQRLLALERLASDNRIRGLGGRTIAVDLAPELLRRLHAAKFSGAVIEDYDLRWRLNLLSLHRILGISLPGFWSRYPDFDRQVQARGGFAVVLDRGRQGDVRFKKRLDKLGLPYRRQVLEGKVIYTELPAQVYQSPGSRLWRAGL